MLRTVCAALTMFVGPAGALLAQSSLTLTPSDASAFPEVSALFLALDADGSPITDVTAGDVRVTENGILRNVLRVDCPPPRSPDSISSVLTIDVSSSMGQGGPNIDIAKAAAGTWVDLLAPGRSECAITSFDTRSYLNQDFTTSRTKLLRAIDDLTPLNGTGYDSAFLQYQVGAIPIASGGRYNRVIIFLTDGLSPADEDRIVTEAAAARATVHCVVVGMSAPVVLRRIAVRTGGFCFDNVRTAAEARNIYRLIFERTINGGLCRLRWESGPECRAKRFTTVTIPARGLTGDADYMAPDSAVVAIDVAPAGIAFRRVIPGTYADTTITITARNQPVTVREIASDDGRFTIVGGGAPPEFTLGPGEQRVVTLRYTPIDSGYAYTRVTIAATLCEGGEIYATGGFPGRLPQQPTLAVVAPDGGERLPARGDTAVFWTGVLPSDVVRLEYSTNGGIDWNVITDSASGLRHGWSVPDTPSETCLMRATQLSRDSVLLLAGHSESVLKAYFSSDGRRVVTASFDFTARVWDAYTGELLLTLPHNGRVRSANFSRDGKYIVTGCSDGAARVWSASTGALVRLLQDPAAPTGEAGSVEFSPDGRRVVSAGLGATPDNIHIWDVATGLPERLLNGHAPGFLVSSVGFSPDGTRVASSGGYDLTVRVWDPFTGVETLIIRDFPSFVHCVNWSPDGRYLVTASATIRIWDAQTGTLVRDMGVGGYWANFSPDGAKLVICNYIDMGNSAWVSVWDVADGALLRSFSGYRDGSYCANFNHNGKRVVSAEKDNTAKIWNLEPEPIQSDLSDTLWAIVRPRSAVRDVAFGAVAVGDTRDSVVAGLLCNGGSIPVNVQDLRIEGSDAGDFSFVSGPPFGRLEPGACASFEFRFRPTMPGQRAAVAAIVVDGDTLRAVLTGLGVDPDIEVTAPWVDFGEVLLGRARDTLVSVMVRNTGNRSTLILGASKFGPDTAGFQIIDGDREVMLAPGATHAMRLRFEPRAVGRTSAHVVFRTEGAGGPLIAGLFGIGVCADLNVTATVALPDTIRASAGETVTVPLRIANSSNLAASGARRFTVVIRCDETLLLPIDTGVTATTVDGQRVLTYGGRWDGVGDTLAVLHFLAALGAAAESPVRIDLFTWEFDCPVTVVPVGGVFQLNDLCVDNGRARLFRNEEEFALKQNRPNPASTATTIELTMIEPGRARLALIDSRGEEIMVPLDRELSPGTYRIDLDLSDVPAGMYRYRLETPTMRRSLPLRVAR